MSEDDLYTDRYDKDDLRQILTLQAEEYRHLRTQALRLIRIVIAIVAVIAATVSAQLLFQVFPEEPLRFSLALNDTAAEQLLLGSEQRNISMSGVELRGLEIGTVNQKLGIRLSLLSGLLLIKSVALSFVVMMSEPPKPIIGVDNEGKSPKSPEDRMGDWINKNILTLSQLSKYLTLSYVSLGLASLSVGLTIAVVLSLQNQILPSLIIIDALVVVVTVAVLIYLTYILRMRYLKDGPSWPLHSQIFGISMLAYLILIGPLATQIIGILWTLIRFLPYLR